MAELNAKYNEVIAMKDSPAKTKLARETRLKLVKVRTGKQEKDGFNGADSVHKYLKEDALKYTQGIDKVRKVIVDFAHQKEDELEQIEKAEENRIKAENEARKNERIEALKAYGTDTTFIDLVNMPDETFEALLIKEKEAFELRLRAEEQRKAEEAARIEAERLAEIQREEQRQTELKAAKEAQEKATERARRINMVSATGGTFDPESGDYRYKQTPIFILSESIDSDNFDYALTVFETAIAAEIKREKEAKEAAERLEKRNKCRQNELRDLGFIWKPETEIFAFENVREITKSEVIEMSEDGWSLMMPILRQKIGVIKEAAQAEADKAAKELKELQEKEKERIAKEKADKLAAKKLAAAPDADKIKAFAEKYLDGIEWPDVESDEAKKIMARAKTAIENLSGLMKNQADKL